jgi:hypothetical protein
MTPSAPSADLFDAPTARLIDLLREYTGKLGKLTAQANDIPLAIQKAWSQVGGNGGVRDIEASVEALQTEFSSLQLSINKLVPVVQELARYTSQMVEHAGLPLLGKLELRLRLAELEAACTVAQRATHIRLPR